MLRVPNFPHALTHLGVPSAPAWQTQALWLHRWAIPAGLSRWCSGKDSGPGHGVGQRCPFEAAEIYAHPEMFC